MNNDTVVSASDVTNTVGAAAGQSSMFKGNGTTDTAMTKA